MILWSHRGFTETKEQENTIESLSNAFNLKYKNIECDVWFLKSHVLMKHDKPTISEVQNCSLVYLKNFIEKYGDKLTYWMDFKNLTLINIDQFLPIYKKIIDSTKIKYDSIYFAPYETYWDVSMKLHKRVQNYIPGINSMAVMDCKSFRKEKIKDYYKILQENKISNLSVEYTIINTEFIDTFEKVTLFAWTVDNMKELERLAKLGIKNICTNKITYADLK